MLLFAGGAETKLRWSSGQRVSNQERTGYKPGRYSYCNSSHTNKINDDDYDDDDDNNNNLTVTRIP